MEPVVVGPLEITAEAVVCSVEAGTIMGEETTATELAGVTTATEDAGTTTAAVPALEATTELATTELAPGTMTDEAGITELVGMLEEIVEDATPQPEAAMVTSTHLVWPTTGAVYKLYSESVAGQA